MNGMGAIEKQNDLVTIVVPAYNAEDFLRENIEAILGQTYKNLEVIYVCDGCTDRTVEILESYQKDSRLKVIVQTQNQGAANSRNNGMEMAKGDWIIFWDADDLFEPDMIESMLRAAKETGSDIAGCYWECFDDKPLTKHVVNNVWRKMSSLNYPIIDVKRDSRYIMQISPKGPCTKLVHKSVYSKPEVYFQNIPNANDVYYSMMTVMNAEKIVFVDRVLLHYRSGNGRKTLTTQRMNHKAYVWEAYDKIYEYILSGENRDRFLKSFYNDVLDTALVYCKAITGERLVDDLVNKYMKKWNMTPEIEEQLHPVNRVAYRKMREGATCLELNEVHKLARLRFLENMYPSVCAIWGAGRYGEKLFESIKGTDIKFSHVYDSSCEKWGMHYHGYCIENFEEVQADHIIVTTPQYYDEIKEKIGNRAEHIYNMEYEIRKVPE